jgi:hypothetical protein
MKTIEQLNKQSDLIHTAALLGARYESSSSYEHLLHLPCGIKISICWIYELDLVFGCETHHQVGFAFTNPRALARKIQSYIWVISAKWDQQNHPENK